MILVDTSVWIDHLRNADPTMMGLLRARHVIVHPFVIGELALGRLRDEGVLVVISELTPAVVAEPADVLHFLRQHSLRGSGIGYVDAHLLASLKLMPSTQLWTRDQRLRRVAERLSLVAPALA